MLSFGGVHAPTRAALHGLLAMGCMLCLWQHDRLLAGVGRVVELGRLVLAAAAVMAVGLLPLPGVLLRVLQPGTAAAAPGRIHTLTWSVVDTLDALTLLGLGGGMVVVVGVWAATRPRRGIVELAALVGTVVVVVVASVHALGGLTSLFGVAETWVRPPKRFFAPFLNDNHTASILLATWPLWLDQALDPARSGVTRAGALVLTVALVGLFVATASLGASLAALAVAGVVAMRRELVPRTVGVAVAVASVLALVIWGTPDFSRAAIWLATLRLWADHPLFGSGAGTFGRAVDAYRTDLDFTSWHHAHNEPLQWVAETGLVGALALVGAVAWWWQRRSPRGRSRYGWLSLGLLGIALHALVEFPLHIPGILLVAAALLAVEQVAGRSATASEPGAVRGALAVMIVAQLSMGAWQVRAHLVAGEAATVLAGGPAAEGAVGRLRTLAPWRSEVGLHEARSRLAAGQLQEARQSARRVAAEHPSEPDALRRAAAILLDVGAAGEAREVVERAVVRDPSDWRPWTVRARIVEVHEPDGAVDAWMEAIRRGAPAEVVRRAWHQVPTGLPWVEAVADRPPRFSRAMGRALASLDPEA
ncbi:MAG: O-antigen ligase family protein, partial [Myxococcota bacterium]